MSILFSCSWADAETWRRAFADAAPDLAFRVWPDEVEAPAEVGYAVVWAPKRGELRRYPNLAAIFSVGAGVDHILRDRDLPAGVPIVRLIEPTLARRMTEYVVHWVLHYHRDAHRYRAQQARGEWRELAPVAAGERRVGILGLGALGRAAAVALAGFGFAVAGWSRTPKAVAGVESFAGAESLTAFLARTDILVCLLPLTAATEGVIDARALAALPAGAVVINAARGGHVVEDDLLAALDSGHVAAATLDVFRDEPLPAAHPFWRHPGVAVTPHVAAMTDPKAAASAIARNIRRLGRGDPPVGLVDPKTGY